MDSFKMPGDLGTIKTVTLLEKRLDEAEIKLAVIESQLKVYVNWMKNLQRQVDGKD